MSRKPRGGVKPPRPGVSQITGWRGRLFEASDIEWLAEEVGYARPPDPAASAFLLDRVARGALDYLASEDIESPPSAHRDWLRNVQHRAEDLLRALGFASSDEVLSERETSFDYAGGMPQWRDGILELQLVSWLLKKDESNIALSEELSKVVNKHQYYLHSMEHNKRVEQINNLLTATPWLIGLLARVTTAGADHYASMTGKGGDTAAVWRKALFRGLAENFKTITGQPLAGLRGSDPDGAGKRNLAAPPVFWCQNVFDLIAQRAPDAMSPAPPNLSEELAKLTALSQGSIIEYLTERPTKGLG